MRFIYLFLSSAITVGLCFVFDTKMVTPVPLGQLLSPQHGIWQNAESQYEDYSGSLNLKGLSGKAEVFFDERLVPHVFAEDENDAYFVQGFLHAKFRLWQMELQTLSAAGRISEIVGDVALDHDREFRRLGMVYAAENSLREIEKDPETKKASDAYTAGVNAYISGLTESKLPVEYKLLGYRPEKWSNLKTALFIKYMAYDLSAHENDFELTNARSFFSRADFDKLFPAIQDSLDPVISKGTLFSAPALVPKIPASADSLYFNFSRKDSSLAVENFKPDRSNGSNNWAVDSAKTKSRAPILCNDPHLGLNFPSLWFEMQISVPAYNAYGVSFPGAPGIIMGYNDSCAFGFTNGGRDVRDYYEIQFKDDSRQEYWFDSAWVKTTMRIETIKIAGKPDVKDTVAYTLFGPVIYDRSFGGKRTGSEKNYAVRWTAHDASNELRFFYELSRTKNYADFRHALSFLGTPGQNCLFACKNGDIAIHAQGSFPAKWKGQGDFIMPGIDSSYMWQSMIPQNEIPFQFNPERHFVSSANQRPADSTYPYYLGRDYPLTRGYYLNRRLAAMQDITVKDMMDLQTDNYNVFAEMAMPLLIKNIRVDFLTATEKKYFDLLKDWNFRNDYDSKGATIFDQTWQALSDTIYFDEYAGAPQNTCRPYESTLLEALLKDSAYQFIDDIRTPQQETIENIITVSYKRAAGKLKKMEAEGRIEWGKQKDTYIGHLLRIPSFGRLHLPVGGGNHSINDLKSNHGPSWRMVISLTPDTEAYGVYPGGQSGNPGSRYYDSFVDKWVKGDYYPLWMMRKDQQNDQRVKWKLVFNRS